MKSTVKTIAVLMFISVASISGTTANGVIKDVPIKPFERLSVGGNLHVILTDGPDQMLRIEGGSKAVSSVVLNQKGSELILSSTDWSKDDEPLTVYLNVTDLNMLIISGDVTVECKTVIHGAVLSVLHKGTGAVKIRSDAALIQTMTTGSGRIAVEGTYARTVSRLNASNHMLVAYSK